MIFSDIKASVPRKIMYCYCIERLCDAFQSSGHVSSPEPYEAFALAQSITIHDVHLTGVNWYISQYYALKALHCIDFCTCSRYLVVLWRLKRRIWQNFQELIRANSSRSWPVLVLKSNLLNLQQETEASILYKPVSNKRLTFFRLM